MDMIEFVLIVISLFLFTCLSQAREDEVSQMRQEIGKVTKMREVMQRKLRVVEENKTQAEGERDTLKNQITGLEKGKKRCFLDGSAPVSLFTY